MEGQTVIPWYYDSWDWDSYFTILNYFRGSITKGLHKHKCQFCGYKGKTHIHHIVPLSKGGAHHISNYIEVCLKCHIICHNFSEGRLNNLLKNEIGLKQFNSFKLNKEDEAKK